jgi:hypothetical protein
MKHSRCLAAALAAAVAALSPPLFAAGSGAAAAVAQEADFAAPALRALTPARRAAQGALAELAERHAVAAGTRPGAFPFDLHDVGELAQARLGFGFQVYDADPSRLLAGESLAHSAQPTGVWRFAVLVGERPVGLITVAEQDGAWQAVSIGGAGLAKDVDAVVAAHGAAALHYVRVPQATADFVEVAGTAEARFVPLAAARESLRLAALRGGDAAVSESALMPALRESVARALAP